MLAFHYDAHPLELPPGHRFPQSKYRLLREHFERHPGLLRMQPGPVATEGELALVHTPDYVDAVLMGRLSAAEQREIGFPWTPSVAERSRRSVGATIAAARAALVEGVAANMAGGTHHAYADKGSGYCVFNDVAVAARVLQAMGLAMNMLVIDLDVHQGDGAAEIFRGDGAVFTFSMHCEDNFPVRKQPGDRDIGLPAGLGDEEYLEILSEQVADLLRGPAPALVFYNAGVDPHEGDRLGKLCLSDSGLARRDALVIGACAERGVPIACVLGGGYDHDAMLLARRHALLYAAADRCYRELRGFSGAAFCSGPGRQGQARQEKT